MEKTMLRSFPCSGYTILEKCYVYHDNVHLHAPTTVSSYTLQFLRHGQHKILKVKVTTARSNQGDFQTKQCNMAMDTYSPKNVPTKYQPHTPSRFQDIARTRF